MVSYKRLYEEQLQALNTICKTDYRCPLCSEPILEQGNEYYCSNEECSFDKTPDEVWYYYAESKELERID